MLVNLFVAVSLTVTQASGQFRSVHVPDRIEPGEPVNIFADWGGEEAAAGIAVELPAGWSLDSTTVLRNGYLRTSVQTLPADGSGYRVLLDQPLKAPFDMVLHVRPGEGFTRERLVLTPLRDAGNGFEEYAALRTERRLTAVDPPSVRTNRVASFAEPLSLLRAGTPDLSADRGYVVSFWLRTAALGEVVLSTWNGDDRRTYPLDVVVDAAGHLRAYRGQPGAHQSLGSRVPVADGSWHLVSISNDPAEGWARLAVDGRTVDSLYAPVPPNIAMELPLVLGGRADGPAPYFDRLDPFSGWLDDVHVAPQDGKDLRLDFEEAIPGEVAAEAGGARYARTGAHRQYDLLSFEAASEPDGVTITWSTSEGSPIDAFLVERSYDGDGFDEIERVETDGQGTYRIFDDAVEDRLVFYRIRQLTPEGGEVLSGTLRVGLGTGEAASVVLLGNFPNPFNATTTLTYEVRERMHIRLVIWDLAGQPVASLIDEIQNAGVYEARFDAADLPSGTYFARLRTPNRTISHKMILTK